MVDLQRGSDETAERLRAWLMGVRGLADVEVDNVTVPDGTGASNETILFDARWAGAPSGRQELVARIAPTSHQVFPDDTFLLQHHIMNALAERSSVPMPTMRWLERDPSWFGSPFWIMERVPGHIPSDMPPYAASGWLADATPGQQARAWASGVAAMAAIHNTPLSDIRIPSGLLDVPGDSLGFELERYRRHLSWAEAGTPFPLARDALVWLDRHQPSAPVEGPTLVWGDARLSNLIYRDFEVVAVLDWEMATVSDPLLDLGWWLFADEALTAGGGADRLPGFLSRTETASRWTSATGRATDDLEYFVVFAGFRFTVIMLRIGKLVLEAGLVPDTFPHDNLISQGLEQALAKA